MSTAVSIEEYQDKERRDQEEQNALARADSDSELIFLLTPKKNPEFGLEFWLAITLLVISFSGCIFYFEQAEKIHHWYQLTQVTPAIAISSIQQPSEALDSSLSFSDKNRSRLENEKLSLNAHIQQPSEALDSSLFFSDKNRSRLENEKLSLSAHMQQPSEALDSSLSFSDKNRSRLENEKLLLSAQNIMQERQAPQQKIIHNIVVALPQVGEMIVQTASHLRWYEMAQQAFESGNLTQANRWVDQALHEKKVPEFHILKLKILLTIQPSAIDAYLKKSQLTPLSAPEILAIFAQAQQNLGRYDKAKWAYQLLLKQEPAHVGWHLGLALALEKLEENKNALVLYLKAVTLTSDSGLKRFAQSRAEHLQAHL